MDVELSRFSWTGNYFGLESWRHWPPITWGKVLILQSIQVLVLSLTHLFWVANSACRGSRYDDTIKLSNSGLFPWNPLCLYPNTSSQADLGRVDTEIFRKAAAEAPAIQGVQAHWPRHAADVHDPAINCTFLMQETVWWQQHGMHSRQTPPFCSHSAACNELHTATIYTGTGYRQGGLREARYPYPEVRETTI